MRALAFLLLIAAIVFTVAGAIGLVFALTEYETAWAGAAVVAIVVPWFGWYLVRQQVRKGGRAGFEAALEDGFPPNSQQWFSGSGLALDVAGKRLLVADDKGAAVYPLEHVEKLKFVPERAGAIVPGAGVSVVSILLTIFAFFAATASHLESGLFITTGGEAARTWHIHSVGKKAAGLWIKRITEAAPHVKTESEA